jgi:hypothetical protein
MTDTPVELDAHRGMAAQKETEIRRALHEVRTDQEALRQRQAELERVLFARPAATWAEAADRASYLIELFAATPEGHDPRRRQLIAGVLADFARLSKAD